jgi:hypothetical protein
MCRNEAAEPVPVVPIEQPVIINAQAKFEAYRQSLNEYLALSDAILGPESEEDDCPQFLEKLERLYYKKKELLSRRVACESLSIADEMYEWDLEEKQLAEKIVKLGEALAKHKRTEAT